MAVVNNNNNAGIVEKALEGKVSFTDFKTFVTNYVTDQNAKCTVEATFSKNYLDFNLVNGLLSVAEFSDTTPNAYHIDSVTLMNTSKKHKLYFCFEVAKNPKYEMTVEPKEGCIKKGSAIVVNFKIRVFCTTRIYQLGKVFLSTSNPAKTSKLWWPTKPPEKMKNVVDHPQLQYLSFRIESDLSTSYDYDDLELGVQLARGGFGTVYVAKWRGSEVAVKMLSQDMIPEEKELVQREIGLMSKLNFQYIVTYMASTKIPGQPLCIIMEYVKEGSLKRLLKKSLDYSFKLKIALDIAKGLAFLHNNNIAHRDIKPDNVLVVSAQRGEHINVKLTDFGTSRCDAMYGKPQVNLNFSPVIAVKHDQPRGGSFHTNSSNNSSKSVTSNSFVEGHSTRTTLTKGVGTLIYSAPEILSGANNYDTQKTDIYSYGILLWELFTQKEPFSEPPMDKWTSREIAEHVINGKRFEIPPTITGELPAIIKACWSQEPDSRPPCNEIVKRLEMLYMDKPEPLPKQIQLDVGWMGEIEREEAENMLHGTVNGTFLFRWSKKQNTFVLSYKDAQAKDPRKPFSHISGITQGKTDMKVYVKTTTGQVVYAGFIEYVEAMRRNGVVSDAMQPRAEEESHYGVTADFKQQQNYDNVSQLRVAKN